jgi:hypothetical protein
LLDELSSLRSLLTRILNLYTALFGSTGIVGLTVVIISVVLLDVREAANTSRRLLRPVVCVGRRTMGGLEMNLKNKKINTDLTKLGS